MTQVSLAQRAERSTARKHRRFFVGFAATVALLVALGFSRTFFVPLARRTFSAPWFVYVHGTFFFVWVGLLVAQSILVASGRTPVHRRVGRIAFGLIPIMAASGVTVALWSSARDFHNGQRDAVVAFFFGELMDMVLFTILAGLALLTRRNAQVHKRLILLATLAVLGAAVGRISELGAISTFIPVVLLLAICWHDVRTRSTIHPATLWGGLFLVVGIFTEPLIGATSWWLNVGRRLLERVHY